MNAKDYLKEHQITTKTAEDFGITWDEDFLHIPIRNKDGKQIFTKSRYLHYPDDTKTPKYKNSKGSTATLFNYDRVKDFGSIVLAEGEIDTIKLHQEEIPAVSSTGGAGTFKSEFADLLKDKKIFIAYDNDSPGREGVKQVLSHLPNAKVVTLPDNTKDICDYFKDHTRQDFFRLVKTAKSKEEFLADNFPEEYSFVSGKELSEMEFDQMPWIIEPILYNEGFCFIYGAEGTGKSFLTLSIAQAVARGEDWLNTFEVEKPRNVLMLDKENPLSLTSRRVKGLGGMPDNVFWLRYPQSFSLHDGKGGISEFAKAVSTRAQALDIDLIVIDSFVDLMVGREASAEDTQTFFNALRQLFPDVAFLVLHHENKPSQGVYRSSSQRLRGSSNINAQTFTMFRLEQVAKSKTEMTLEQTKSRDALKLDKFMIRMDVLPNKDGSTDVTGFSYMGIVVSQEAKKEAEAEEMILSSLQDAPGGQLSRQNIITIGSANAISERTMDRVLNKLEEEGQLRKAKSGRQVVFLLSNPIVKEGKKGDLL